ncbi:MAG: 2OG-Fe(II) oxygenase [Actinomyces sp.]|jgi:hypothetical protein|nr:2OG-Fe(II) oxygenase [Actinomyces sp.]MCI1641525.1 2OG-Fe(II) oxygenase [Actinomyces sp.]MCI1661731.1 2OG-Fe(II) oxygenase [Actinomyces sp.]MCI1690479.1 2OG-Fe(II) oxygenase [Actinomyces sp.]MCI1786460.1 2OG-Fe(II) oxygenase [Actinomyces sp.]MCI1866137.1 2OG-Fe(II) oxygenase [Actinomyces sp.]
MTIESTQADVWEERVDTGNGETITAEVNEYGGALLPRLLSDEETQAIRELYTDDTEVFRSTIDMGRHRFGEGEFPYFSAPYPEPIERLKQTLSPHLLRTGTRCTATLLPHGHGYLFTTRDRPVGSKWGWSVAPVRHGVSAIRSGERHTLALVFHDAA